MKLLKKYTPSAVKLANSILMLSDDEEDEVEEKAEMTAAEYLSECVSEFMTLVNHPPKTWEQYKKEDGSYCWDKIINMEIMELREMREKGECCDEYLHCAVAFFHAYYDISWKCMHSEEE